MSESSNESGRRLILLGPQHEYRSLGRALDRLQISGNLALITAGWEEDEQQDEPLRQAVSVPLINLELFHRSEQLFRDDPELIALLQARQDDLRTLRDVYRMRLELGLKAARRLIDDSAERIELDPERVSSLEMVRQLDQQYFVRTSQICDRYDQQLELARRPHVVTHRRQISELLANSQAILIAGGHAAIILNRLKIFGVLEQSAALPIVAWSAAAMALSDQIVFFHDSPPQGPGNAEVLRAGMGLFHEILPLPDADHRLDLADKTRVALFAQRFARYRCVVFDETTLLDRNEGRWNSQMATRCLNEDGTLGEFLR